MFYCSLLTKKILCDIEKTLPNLPPPVPPGGLAETNIVTYVGSRVLVNARTMKDV